MRKKKYNAIFGKYLLDSISIGMYNNPLMLFREYIQNSTDSIDELAKRFKARKSQSKRAIEISINGQNHSITIKDYGVGVSIYQARHMLHNVGVSSKKQGIDRGFRGIGRLGGLGYCDTLRFVTKASGENKYSISTWDCKKLKHIIANNKSSIEARNAIEQITQLELHSYKKNIQDNFFIVEMLNVKSSRNILLNVPAIKDYISQVAPVPFQVKNFSWSKTINSRLRLKVPKYSIYDIYVNGEQIYKPYKDTIIINKSLVDKIQNVDFIEFKHDEELLAIGWVANLALLGAISKASGTDGLRLRSGNIMVDNKEILSTFFREKRFNKYLLGEVHIINKLILNSRRDDFEDSVYKENFFNSFAKEIGIPFSRKIREVSMQRSLARTTAAAKDIVKVAKRITRNGYLSQFQKEKITNNLVQIKNNSTHKTQAIDKLINKLNKSRYIFQDRDIEIPDNTYSFLETMLDVIHKECKNQEEAERISNIIITKTKSMFARNETTKGAA